MTKVLNDMLILSHVLSDPQRSRLNHAMRRKLRRRHCALEHILAELRKVIFKIKQRPWLNPCVTSTTDETITYLLELLSGITKQKKNNRAAMENILFLGP